MTTVTQSPRPRVQSPPRQTPKKRPFFQELFAYIRENWLLFALGTPALILIFLFSYIPMFGTVIAFQDYSPRTMFASPWVGFRNFRLLVESPLVMRLVVNTISLNVSFIIATTFFAVLSALLLNEVRSVSFKRLAQSLMFLPFFMGWTVVAMVLFGLIDYEVGTINAMLEAIGRERIIITDKPDLWPWILTMVRIWKGTGAGCIIYLASLTSIDTQLYEAAAFFGDFGMIYAVIGDKAQLYPTTDVIDTYLLRALRTNSNYGFSAAIGLLQSVLGFICIFGSNWLVKKYSERRGEDYSLF
jgi:putative aldouronate transport system permease protein